MFGDMNVTSVEQVCINGIPLGSALTKEQAQAIYDLGNEAVIFALLTQAKIIAESEQKSKPKVSDDPSCPSAQKPTYEKQNSNGRKKKPGRKKGHPGTRRSKPDKVDHTVECRADRCPDCGSKLKQCRDCRDRYVEDIPEGIKVEVIRFIIHRDFCPRCRKIVEPPVTDALPRSTIGNRLLILSAWLHYCMGTTISQVLGVFNFHLHFKITPSGLIHMWHRLADILEVWYDEIAEDILRSGVLFGDETGWRVNGKTHWLWCFTTPLATLFAIERSRAGPVVLKFIKDCFDGVLVSDFWGAYNILVCAKQKCLVHLLRELERVEKYKSTSADWALFSKRLRRLIRDAIRLHKRKSDLDAAVYQRRLDRIESRLKLMIAYDWSNKEAQRLVKRLRRHQHELFTFLWEEGVPFDNNFAERMIRGAVIMRKNSYNNRSDKGARTQAILMSVFTTLKQRGLNPLDTMEKALKTYIKTGQLPKLAELSASLC